MAIVNQLKRNIIADFDFLKLLTLSDYLTLVDGKGQPVIFEFNGQYYFFTFNKQFYDLNLNNHISDFKFFEKLYLGNLLKPDYCWKNLINFSFLKTIQDYIPIEPRNFVVEIVNSCPKFFISSLDENVELKSYSNLITV